MNFELTEDQKLVAKTAKDFAKQKSPVSRFREVRSGDVGFDPGVWRHMGELGWLSIPFSEELGGFGGTFVEVALVLERLGATLVPEPIIPSVVLAGMAIAKAAPVDQAKRWLEPMMEGQQVLAFGYAESGNRYGHAQLSTQAAKRGAEWVLRGEKAFVLAGNRADELVVSAAADGGVGLFVIPRDAKGLTITPVRTIDGQWSAMLRLDEVTVPADRVLGTPGEAAPVVEHVLDYAAAAACAEGVGVCQATLDMTKEHLKTREQFGVPIGKFQALQHRAVEMYVELELCRSVATMVSVKVDDPDPVVRKRAVSAAKAQIGIGGRFISQQAIQLHGGIGITEEHDIGLYFKRMQALGSLFGDTDHHTRRFAALPSFLANVSR